MGIIKVLDCTLRDGGYCNEWTFGKKNISKIIDGLVSSKVDIIECGFLTNKICYSQDVSKYTKIEQLNPFIPNLEAKQKFVVMINYGEYDIEDIPECKDTMIHGIRLAFHKSVRNEAIQYCKKLKNKGYFVFVQPMVTMNYTDEEFIEMVKMSNEIKPYAFYIVDSFGTMKKKTLLHYLSLVKSGLSKTVAIGFHAHNNFQSAFSNALCLVEEVQNTLIIDVSVYGMGRGAGNLNTELFLNELNKEFRMIYNIKPLLQIMDEVLNRFYEAKPWGYSLPNYLSAIYTVHPNYANYLCEKNNLTLENIDDIFSLMDPDKGLEFEEKYIEEIYEQYMSRGIANNKHLEKFKKLNSKKSIFDSAWENS